MDVDLIPMNKQLSKAQIKHESTLVRSYFYLFLFNPVF